MADKTNGVVEL